MNIPKVDHSRWQEAQKWEESHWVNAEKARSKFGKKYIWHILSALKLKPKYMGNDWNDWWREKFDNYRFLPKEVENAIELGCGPYTNMRLLLENVDIQHLFLSDPLIKTYVKFKNTFVNDMYLNSFCIIDDHPIEELPFKSNYFDLTVMINVLDHVRDADLCMQNAIEITKPGGILIVGQDLTNDEDIKRNPRIQEDIGHPIRLEHKFLDKYLEGNFQPLFKKLLFREESRNDSHYGTYLFAGKKEANFI